jgi:hypothetical protein
MLQGFVLLGWLLLEQQRRFVAELISSYKSQVNQHSVKWLTAQNAQSLSSQPQQDWMLDWTAQGLKATCEEIAAAEQAFYNEQTELRQRLTAYARVMGSCIDSSFSISAKSLLDHSRDTLISRACIYCI